jgi:hypothetical protein
MRIGVVVSGPERFVQTVNRRYPGAVINHTSNTAKFGDVELIMVNTPDRVVGYEFDKAWLDESGSFELSALIQTRVRSPAA